MRPLVFHDWRAIAATVTAFGGCAIVMRSLWRSRPRIAASGADRRHVARYTRGLGAVHVLALGAPVVAPVLTPPGSPWVLLGAGLALYVLGQALRGWAISTLGDWFQGALVVQEGQHVVESGPYRLIRHPAYAGGILRAAGLGLVLDNWLSLALLVAGMVAVRRRAHPARRRNPPLGSRPVLRVRTPYGAARPAHLVVPPAKAGFARRSPATEER